MAGQQGVYEEVAEDLQEDSQGDVCRNGPPPYSGELTQDGTCESGRILLDGDDGKSHN